MVKIIQRKKNQVVHDDVEGAKAGLFGDQYEKN